jgi:hydrogenase-4 component F
VLGFGTKMGLVPVHTWLPDAHSEAPTPVSALLSGSLLAVSFYAILRFYQVTQVAVGPRIPRNVLLVFGVASLLLAALYLFGQRDCTRLLAYSSVEHMGIMAIGISFGAPAAVAGVLLHVLAHAAAKGNAFLGAGVLVRKFGLKGLSAIRGGLDLLPWSGPLFLLAVFALGAMPPFGLFRSEFEIVAGGFATHGYAGAAVLIIGVTVAFLGLAAALMPVLLEPARHAPAEAMPVRVHAAAAATPVTGTSPAATTGDGAVPVTGDGGQPGDAPAGPASPARGEPSTWMVLPVLAGVIVLLVLGIHPPAELNELFSRAVAMLTGRS